MTMKRFGARHVAWSFVVLAGLVIAVRRVSADAPPGRYTVTNGGTPTGTVLDTRTGLTWQQMVPPSSYTWADAGTYCTSNTAGLPGTGWRLPSMQELQTIVDDSRLEPAIDPNAFPSTPMAAFWASSAYAYPGIPGGAWNVDCIDGSAYGGTASTPSEVRCVR